MRGWNVLSRNEVRIVLAAVLLTLIVAFACGRLWGWTG